jgi:hypothetical protein
MDAPAAPQSETVTEIETVTETAAFRELDQALRTSGPAAVLDQLIRHLTERGEMRLLLDAMLLKARHELGLPLIQAGNLAALDEPVRTQFEERYVAAIRTVGAKLLEAGDIPGAWPYFRAIGEPESVAGAIAAYSPSDEDERLGAIIEVAFNQGANPGRGFELILDQYGTCSAITAFEHLPPDEPIRLAAADRLVRRLHDDLVANLRSEIAQRGQPTPPASATIADLVAGRPWLFADDAYHVDISHLAAVVRVAPMLRDPASIARAVDLTEYGRHLSPRHQVEGEPPFEAHYEDHAVYLRALLGRDADRAIAHFRGKLSPAVGDADGDGIGDGVGVGVGGRAETTYAAQILVGLLLRLDRLDEAIDVAAEHLAGLPESALICPSLPQLCQRAGQPGRLAGIARAHGDLVHYVAAILQGEPTDPLASPPAGR